MAQVSHKLDCLYNDLGMNVGCTLLRPSNICFLQITRLDSAINQNVN